MILKAEDNYVFQLTNSLNEENTIKGINENTYNLSIIELGECEDTLKEVNNINKNTPLIIYKIEKMTSLASQKNIQYEVYNPDTKEKLDLSVCLNYKINIYIKVILDEETLNLNQDLLNYGYDLFNSNDSFYQDICSGYTSSNGTDVLLSDRRAYYFNNTQTACQEDCEYSKYLVETQQLKCECSVNQKDIEPEKDNKFDKKIIYTSFYDVLKYSNFLVLKCYDLVFSYKGQKVNWGSIIMIIYFLFYFIFNFMYFKKGFFYMKLYVAKIVFNYNIIYNLNNNRKKVNFNKNNSLKKRKKKNIIILGMPPKKKNIINIFDKHILFNEGDNKSSEKMKIKSSNSLLKLTKKNYFKKDNSNYIYNKTDLGEYIKSFTDKTFSNNSNIFIIKDKININNNSINNINNNINESDIKGDIKVDNNSNNINFSNNKYYKTDNSSYIKKRFRKKFINNHIYSNYKKNNLSDLELNELSYYEAIKYDKRTFCEYYWQLTKSEHVIFFTFFSCNDNNILYIKLSKFIFGMALDLALNVFFFVDKSMHKIFLDYGKYDFIAQIPQILYSTLVSQFLDFILKYVCLTEKDIYKIKQFEKEKDKFVAKKNIFKSIKYMKIKILLYFLVSFIFMCFFWYFISAFCAVYKNTQLFLIKDTMISFLISLLYPFALYILPKGLRIISLNDEKKRLKFLYILSDLIPLI